ncbi:unnamed protein product [Symbiodinium natans]|uniref:Uncharacterized protein n=1 Tax=Symbiodinium natans TaxID=878477 RepID=A0A812PAS2_9DINO|nr:unnamed protein product [Symbiodinium natans]
MSSQVSLSCEQTFLLHTGDSSEEVATSESKDEDQMMQDAAQVLRIGRKEFRVACTKLSELATNQLAFCLSMLHALLTPADALELGGELDFCLHLAWFLQILSPRAFCRHEALYTNKAASSKKSKNKTGAAEAAFQAGLP